MQAGGDFGSAGPERLDLGLAERHRALSGASFMLGPCCTGSRSAPSSPRSGSSLRTSTHAPTGWPPAVPGSATRASDSLEIRNVSVVKGRLAGQSVVVVGGHARYEESARTVPARRVGEPQDIAHGRDLSHDEPVCDGDCARGQRWPAARARAPVEAGPGLETPNLVDNFPRFRRDLYR